jgi:hypothetical protein
LVLALLALVIVVLLIASDIAEERGCKPGRIVELPF